MLKQVKVKSVLNKTKKRDAWFLDDYSINLYSSCSFNCLYCYIRGSKYGTHLENSLSIKSNAIEVLDRQLFNRAKKEQYGIIVLSSATDPYLPVDQEHELTREALKLIHHYKFPVHVITKSHFIERDFDLLHQINQSAILPNDLTNRLPGGIIISFSFSTLDDQVAKIFESGATPPSVRIKTVEKVIKEGFHSGISLMPLLPYISDTTESLDLFYTSFKNLNVNYVLPATITLFGQGKADSKTLIFRAIEKHYPELLPKYRKFFLHSNQMPSYYQRGFNQKMNELSKEYKIPRTILKSC